MQYSVIIPTYNERENLPIVVYLITKAFKSIGEESFEIIVVDDSSPDGTYAVAKKLQNVFKDKIVLLSREGKLGLGSAYIFGLKQAQGQFVFILDADLSHHPSAIPEMIRVQKTKKYDIVSGTRYLQGGGVCGWKWTRRLTSAGANVVAGVALGQASSDMTGSYRLYKRSVLMEILPQVKARGFTFQMEIIVRAAHKGYTIGE
ncbi:MAG: putative Dolichol-phosphate mannosyltransferase, partial [Streblomastix strix]